MAEQKLQAAYPWTQKPLICNGPMRGFAGAALATEVSKAGGLGFIAEATVPKLSPQLDEAQKILSSITPAGGRLPVGVGFLTAFQNLAETLPVLKKYRPAAVWLFAAPELSDYADWAREIRGVCDADIWVQTGSVDAALTIARLCKPDVLVIQGTDAGGHGLERGAGVISLLPEAADALEKEGFGNVPLLGAGGIADARGVAATIVLGASGAVMGTRFLATKEAILPHQGYMDAILEATDGGQATVRSKVFDDLNPGGNIWPVPYDGRSLRNQTYEDSLKGMGIEENRKLHQQAMATSDKGYGGKEKRVNLWAGTGVGLIRDLKDAGTIVEEARSGAEKLLSSLPSKI